MTKIIFRQAEPGVKTEIERFLLPVQWLLPTWCHQLFINVYMDGDGVAIRTSVTPEYRFAKMDFYSSWLACSDKEKAKHVIHDVLHVTNCGYLNFVEDAFRNLCPESENPKLLGYLIEQSRMQNEAMTEDLAVAICNKLLSANER